MKFPITPDYLQNAPEALIAIYHDLEDDLIRYICEQFQHKGEANETSLEYIRVLQRRGLPLKEIEKRIRKATGLSKRELNKIFDGAINRNQAYFKDTLTKAKLIFSKTRRQALQMEVDAIVAQAGDAMNISQSLGFAIRNAYGQLEFSPIAEAYQKVLNKALVSVWAGGMDYNTAIRNSVKELADSGLQTIDYSTGYHCRTDVAVRRAVMTGTTQISAKYSEALAEDIGTEFVEVTAHRGARDKGEGPENHKSWQGRVYHVGSNAVVDGVTYKSLEAVTGYGTGEGLCGWNCRHHFHPFVPGIMEPTYTEEELNNIDPPPFTFEGKTYTMYEATQKQRQIESALRNIKRRMIGFDSSGQTEEYNAAASKYRRLNDEYEKFSKAADLPLQRERANIAEFGPKEHRQAMKTV